MRQEELFQRLREAAIPDPFNSKLPTEADITALETALDVQLPPSYRAYLLGLSDTIVGFYTPLLVHHEMIGGRLFDMARDLHSIGMPEFLTPFVDDNGDAYCFDTRSDGPEFAVVLWAHDDQSIYYHWPNFLSWVEDRWIPIIKNN